METTSDIIAAAVENALAQAHASHREVMNQAKRRYYLAHKDEPEFIAKVKEQKARYYQKYRDRIKTKNLQAYYNSKENAQNTIVA